jgi:hypothetical protein
MLVEFLGTILDEVGGVAGLYALVYEYGEHLRRDPARVAEAADFYAGIFRILARS